MIKSSSLKQYQTKTLNTKVNKNKELFKDFLLLRYPNFFKNDAILPSSEKRNFSESLWHQRIQPKALCYSLIESLFYMK